MQSEGESECPYWGGAYATHGSGPQDHGK